MLIEATEDHIDVLAEYAWSVYQDDEKRTTPPYKSQQEMYEVFKKKVLHKEERVLAYYENDLLEGVFCLQIQHENCYAQSTGGPYVADPKKYVMVATVFMDYIKANCSGYECYYGMPRSNIAAQKFLEAQGFECTEDTVQMLVTADMLKPVKGKFDVERLTEKHHEAYRKFHETHFGDYYWHAERLFGALDQWVVHLVIEDEIIGGVFTRKQSDSRAEIYGSAVLPQYAGTDLRAQLVYHSSKACLDEGIGEVLNFVPEGEELYAAKCSGYEVYDTYMCYYKGKV